MSWARTDQSLIAHGGIGKDRAEGGRYVARAMRARRGGQRAGGIDQAVGAGVGGSARIL